MIVLRDTYLLAQQIIYDSLPKVARCVTNLITDYYAIIAAVGLRVDCLDSFRWWYEAQIVFLSPNNTAEIFFYGYGVEFNEFVCAHEFESRLAPINSYSPPGEGGIITRRAPFYRYYDKPLNPEQKKVAVSRVMSRSKFSRKQIKDAYIRRDWNCAPAAVLIYLESQPVPKPVCALPSRVKYTPDDWQWLEKIARFRPFVAKERAARFVI